MKNQIFRQYDIRGIVGKELEIKNIETLTEAIIYYFKQKNKKLNTIILGYDGRTHSPLIKNKIIKATTNLGINIIDIGLCPTPVFYFSLFNLKADSGMIITASHNPKEYNGLKICLKKKSVWGKEIQEIRKIYKNYSEEKKLNKLKYIKKKGIITKYNIIPEYIEWIANHFKHLKNYKLNALIDCGNGTAGSVLPSLIKKMNWKNVELLYEKVDGNFPNHEADPTTYKNMQDVSQKLKESSTLKLGIGLDGDCDRMTPMTKSGYLVPGDQLLALYAKKVLKNHPNATIVFDIKASSSLIQLLKKWKANNHISPSGHSIIKQAMFDTNAKLAGELSCHFFFNDRYFGYDDGIYAILRLFEIIQEEKKSLDELIKIFPKQKRSPEIRISCSQKLKNKIIKNVKTIFAARKDVKSLTIDGIRAEMNYGWGLARASNTQNIICLRFESNTESGLQKVKNDFYNAIEPYFDNKKKLKEEIEL